MNKSLHSCNVLEVRADHRHLWQFSANDGTVSLVTEVKAAPDEPFPARLVTREWHSLWRKKFNVAWLPPDQVFLRVLQLPAADRSELQSMVEFQLEKISPLPVTQVVWSMEALPHPLENMHTVVALIAARDRVEEFLGKLEGDNYLADRLELPHLHQLLALPGEKEGVYIFYDGDESKPTALVAWWAGSVLQNLQFLLLSAPERRVGQLVAELNQMAWAGEMEGWFSPPAKVRLVTDPDTAATWKPALAEWSGQSVDTHEPLSKRALAELAAARASTNQSQANLLPPGYAEQYRQRFIDRLWMRGLGAALVVYLAGVLIYFAVLGGLTVRANQISGRVVGLSGSYTNALQLRAKVEVLQDQLNLKYAALDCLKVASENLLDGLSLVTFNFSRDKVSMRGTAAEEDTAKVMDYSERLQKAAANGKLIFSHVDVPNMGQRAGGKVDWLLNCVPNLPKVE